jgi:AraC family transcriptional regulator
MSAFERQHISDLALPQLDSQPAEALRQCLPATSGSWRVSTLTSHYRAIEQAIHAMRERWQEPLSLHAMAETAQLSQYHFNRVFRHITGIPPCRFLAALRIEAAKHLLLTTCLSVTDVCFEVGYNSLGTFTSHFTQSVGLSPCRLRRLSEDRVMSRLNILHEYASEARHLNGCGSGVSGRVGSPEVFTGLICVGLFPTSIPQGRPVSCTLLTSPGAYCASGAPDGRYYLCAVAFAQSADPLSYLLPSDASLRVGSTRSPLHIHAGRTSSPIDVVLRPLRLTDPPILVALPLLLAEHCATSGATAA